MSLKLNVQHDYITLKMPNGNFTISWSGYKFTGNVPVVVQNALIEYVEKYKGNNGDAMKSLSDPKVMRLVWPTFDVVETYTFKVGEIVKIKGAPKYGIGTIDELRAKFAVIAFLSGSRIKVPFHLIERA